MRSTPSWPEQTLRLGDLSTPPAINRYLSDEPGVVRVKKSHLIYLAALILGCMTAVFLIGLYAGRDQGVRAALAEYGGEVARIPVADPATTALSAAANSAPEVQKTPPAPQAVNEAVTTPQVADMDFRPEAKLRAGDPETNPAPTGAAAGAPAIDVKKAAPIEKPVAEPTTLKKVDTKTEATKPAETLKPVDVKAGAGSWYIQAGAARNEQEAATYVRKYKAAGLQARVEKADVKGSRYFRLIVGPYPDKSSADKDVRKVANSKVLKSDPFVRLIK